MVVRKEQKHRGGQEKSDYDQKVLDVRRTARVVAGGRRFSFRATVAVGNRNGKVGLGVGKGADVTEAIEKGVHRAKKVLVEVVLTEDRTIPHEVEAKFSSARVLLKPASDGHGLVCGGPVRAVSELAGIRNLTAKIISRTTNKLNNARATLEALKKLQVKS